MTQGIAVDCGSGHRSAATEARAKVPLSRVQIHRIICGQFGGPSTHNHQACENAANAVHAALAEHY